MTDNRPIKIALMPFFEKLNEKAWSIAPGLFDTCIKSLDESLVRSLTSFRLKKLGSGREDKVFPLENSKESPREPPLAGVMVQCVKNSPPE
jgi:hypothetical protein